MRFCCQHPLIKFYEQITTVNMPTINIKTVYLFRQHHELCAIITLVLFYFWTFSIRPILPTFHHSYVCCITFTEISVRVIVSGHKQHLPLKNYFHLTCSVSSVRWPDFVMNVRFIIQKQLILLNRSRLDTFQATENVESSLTSLIHREISRYA